MKKKKEKKKKKKERKKKEKKKNQNRKLSIKTDKKRGGDFMVYEYSYRWCDPDDLQPICSAWILSLSTLFSLF